MINLKGKTVVPGLIEGHVHVVSLANRPGYHVVIEQATNIADIQELLAARRPNVPEGQFITAMGGWSTNFFAERRLPTLAELDAAVSDRPVFIYSGGGGPAVTNSLGKAFFESVSDALAGPVVVGPDGRDRDRQPEPGEPRALPPARAADVRGQEAQRASTRCATRRASA